MMTWILFLACLLTAAGLLFSMDSVAFKGSVWVVPPIYAVMILGILACLGAAGRIAGVW